MSYRRAVPLVALAGLLLAVPTSAATTNVTIQGFAFQPRTVRVAIGDTVRWTNQDSAEHSVTRSGFPSFSMDLEEGVSRSRLFRQAGTYGYVCRFHDSMTCAVAVLVRATPRNGSPGTTFTIRVANRNAAAGTTYVIERRSPGGTFRPWRTTTSPTVSFRSSVEGTWRFRSKVQDTSSGRASGFSPAASITIG